MRAQASIFGSAVDSEQGFFFFLTLQSLVFLICKVGRAPHPLKVLLMMLTGDSNVRT